MPSAHKNGRGSLTSHNASLKGIVPQGKANVKRENENVTTIHNLTEADLEAMYESPGIPVKFMLEVEDGEGKTIWSLGAIKERSLSPSNGSSSNHSGMRRTNSGRKTSSATIIYTSEGKSQGKNQKFRIDAVLSGLHINQIEAQRSGFDLGRRSSGMSAL